MRQLIWQLTTTSDANYPKYQIGRVDGMRRPRNIWSDKKYTCPIQALSAGYTLALRADVSHMSREPWSAPGAGRGELCLVWAAESRLWEPCKPIRCGAVPGFELGERLPFPFP